jgi:hypothetical protein
MLSPFGLVSDSCNTYSVDIGTKSRLELMKIDAKIRTRLWGASGSSFSVCCQLCIVNPGNSHRRAITAVLCIWMLPVVSEGLFNSLGSFCLLVANGP